MNNTKHTPGPWVLQPIRDGEKVIRYSIWKEPTESPEDVVGSAYSLPNAHLIAAAPAMYEALREAQELIRSLVAEEMIHSTELQRVGNCQANMWEALAQAEARS